MQGAGVRTCCAETWSPLIESGFYSVFVHPRKKNCKVSIKSSLPLVSWGDLEGLDRSHLILTQKVYNTRCVKGVKALTTHILDFLLFCFVLISYYKCC